MARRASFPAGGSIRWSGFVTELWTVEHEEQTVWLVLGGRRVGRMDGGSGELARLMVAGLNVAEKMRLLDIQVHKN